ncbi:hypothetical protein AFK68_28670 [Hydrocoleum sp. CS-953]|nr:hypothetical protein AFK68_28670 [Hydrocoleum sp. CS-953]
MAEVESGERFELYRVVQGIRAVCQIFMWQCLWRFFWSASCQAVTGNAIFTHVPRKCTLKIKYGLGSKTLLFKLTKIPIRD